MSASMKKTLESVRLFLKAIGAFSEEQITNALNSLCGKETALPRLLKQRDIARELSVCRQTIKAWELAGKIRPIVLPDGQRRYKLDDIFAGSGKSEDRQEGVKCR